MKLPVRVTIIAALIFIPLLILCTGYYGIKAADVAHILFFISAGFAYLIHRILKKRENRLSFQKRKDKGDEDEQEDPDSL